MRPLGRRRYEENIFIGIFIPIFLITFTGSKKLLIFGLKTVDMYLEKINPSTRDMSSEAFILPRRTQAASHICFSKPILLVLCFPISFSETDFWKIRLAGKGLHDKRFAGSLVLWTCGPRLMQLRPSFLSGTEQ